MAIFSIEEDCTNGINIYEVHTDSEKFLCRLPDGRVVEVVQYNRAVTFLDPDELLLVKEDKLQIASEVNRRE